MAWIARSIANTLKLDEEEDEVGEKGNRRNYDENSDSDHESSDGQRTGDDPITSRGVKEDLSELTNTLRSQLWGVASFLAPPPPPDQQEKKDLASDDREASSEGDVISSIRSDFAEIGGRFRTGMSKLSSKAAVSEFTKMASSLLQLGSEEEVDAVGVTEEVVAFARDIAMHPETWTDFPFPDEDDDFSDFDMTDAQLDHALAVERLAPSLAALRIELCPGYMSEGCFWKIYFVLLHPKLSKHDALLLSTPQVLEARAMLSSELQRQNKAASVSTESLGTASSEVPASMEQLLSVSSGNASESVQPKTIPIDTAPSTDLSCSETEKYPVLVTETHVVDKSVIDEKTTHNAKPETPTTDSSKIVTAKSDDDEDDWLKEEETSESTGATGTMIPISNDEDVSFSDLEDDEDDIPISGKNAK